LQADAALAKTARGAATLHASGAKRQHDPVENSCAPMGSWAPPHSRRLQRLVRRWRTVGNARGRTRGKPCLQAMQALVHAAAARGVRQKTGRDSSWQEMISAPSAPMLFALVDNGRISVTGAIVRGGSIKAAVGSWPSTVGIIGRTIAACCAARTDMTCSSGGNHHIIGLSAKERRS